MTLSVFGVELTLILIMSLAFSLLRMGISKEYHLLLSLVLTAKKYEHADSYRAHLLPNYFPHKILHLKNTKGSHLKRFLS